MTVAECIHGLELTECEVCTPRQLPDELLQRLAPRSSRHAGAPKPSSAAAVAVRAAETRRYFVVAIDELADVLASPLTEDEAWRLELIPTDREQVVIVATLADPDGIQLLGVANEPARRRVTDTLRGTDRSPRVVINPAWFA